MCKKRQKISSNSFIGDYCFIWVLSEFFSQTVNKATKLKSVFFKLSNHCSDKEEISVIAFNFVFFLLNRYNIKLKAVKEIFS